MGPVDAQRSAELQVLLEGVPLPAGKRQLVEYARRYDPAAAAELARLPDREYRRLDDVGQALSPTEPQRSTPERLPRAESGDPPGGDDYLRARPTSGAVRR
jgi:hypothetical protein